MIHTTHLAERAGFSLPSFCKVIKRLYLQLNTSNSKDLESLVSLLFQHDFLLFWYAFWGQFWGQHSIIRIVWASIHLGYFRVSHSRGLIPSSGIFEPSLDAFPSSQVVIYPITLVFTLSLFPLSGGKNESIPKTICSDGCLYVLRYKVPFQWSDTSPQVTGRLDSNQI